MGKILNDVSTNAQQASGPMPQCFIYSAHLITGHAKNTAFFQFLGERNDVKIKESYQIEGSKSFVRYCGDIRVLLKP